MTRTNMSLATIAGLWRDEKPLYLETTEAGKTRRLRIHGVRVWRGKFQAKVSRSSNPTNPMWEYADHKQVVCAY